MEAPAELARQFFDAALRSVQADMLLENFDWCAIAGRPLEAFSHVAAAAMGKAALASAAVFERDWTGVLDDGYAVVPKGYVSTIPDRFALPECIEIGEGGHPLPDEGSIHAAHRVLQLSQRLAEDDLLIVLISGGGSALCTDFPGDITLDDAQTTFDLLLQAGADIYALNTVRKHMTRIGGGRLAAAASPARVVSVIISDVVGDDLSIIASGPTVGDPTTFSDAVDVLRDARLWDEVPESVRRHFESGLRTGEGETPGPDSPIFDRVTNRIVASNKTALEAAADAAKAEGYGVCVDARPLTGEAREVGRRIAREALDRARGERICLIAGGETTVTVHGEGRGGRNQELALAAALEISEAPVPAVFLSGGTDGIDGPTDAAGAVVTRETIGRARQAGLDPKTYLDRNDSYAFFERVGGLLRTGPTHTNVMDVTIALIG